MTDWQGKKVLITGGGTLEKWDEVRGHTNLARGTMGCYLAEQALCRGAEVIYLHGYFAKVPQEHERLRLVPFMGIEELEARMREWITEEAVDAVIMTAAVSDWVIDKILDQEGQPLGELGKIPSDQPPVIHFKKAPKIISQVRDWHPDVVLVGFKLEATSDEQELLRRANLRMSTWRSDLVVANSSGSLYTEATPHYIVSQSGAYEAHTNKEETAKALLEQVAACWEERR